MKFNTRFFLEVSLTVDRRCRVFRGGEERVSNAVPLGCRSLGVNNNHLISYNTLHTTVRMIILVCASFEKDGSQRGMSEWSPTSRLPPKRAPVRWRHTYFLGASWGNDFYV